jgi:hypothetical protein
MITTRNTFVNYWMIKKLLKTGRVLVYYREITVEKLMNKINKFDTFSNFLTYHQPLSNYEPNLTLFFTTFPYYQTLLYKSAELIRVFTLKTVSV